MVFPGYNLSVFKDNENEDDIDDDDDDEPKAGFCCLGGCLTGCSICFLVMVILPAGILLTIYASNNKHYDVLSAGVILIAFPVIAIPIAIAIYLNRRRIRRIRKRKINNGQERKNSRNATKY